MLALYRVAVAVCFMKEQEEGEKVVSVTAGNTEPRGLRAAVEESC